MVAELLLDDGDWLIVAEDLDLVATEVVGQLGLDDPGDAGDDPLFPLAESPGAGGLLALSGRFDDLDRLELLIDLFNHLNLLFHHNRSYFNLLCAFLHVNLMVNIFILNYFFDNNL